MKSTPFRATGEAMPITVDESTIEASADLLALLSVCAFTAGRMAYGDEDAARLASEVARCLRWANCFADQTHGDMVRLRGIHLKGKA